MVTLLLEQTVAPNGSPEAGAEGPSAESGAPAAEQGAQNSPAPRRPVFCLSARSRSSTWAAQGEQPSDGEKASGERRGICSTRGPRGS